MGSPTRELSPDLRKQERAILQGLVDGSFAEFKRIVVAGRKTLAKSEKDHPVVFSGRVFSAPQAMKLGLIDKIGFMEDAVDHASKLAGITSDEKLRIVKYTRHQPGLVELLGGTEASAREHEMAVVRSLMRLSTPRPYYLQQGGIPGALTEPVAD